MNKMKLKRLTITDRSGTRQEAYDAVVFRTVEWENGYACYINAEYPDGLDGAESLIFALDVEDASAYVAIVNHSRFWCRPFWGACLAELPARVQMLLIDRGTCFECYLPLCGDTFKTLIRGARDGMELLTYSNDTGLTACLDQPAFVYMQGKDPHALVHDCAKAAACLLNNGLKLREEKRMSPILEYLGWCSWDALQIRVNHAGLLEKAKEFQTKEVPVGFAIIDDMWADVPELNDIPVDSSFKDMVKAMHQSRLRSFRGDPIRFPQGMAAAVRDLNMTIPHVGIWFPTTGYWSGLEPDGEAAKQEAQNLVVTENGQWIVAPDEEKATRYFADCCATIRSWGADFVKIDNQGFHTRYQNIAPIGQSSAAIQHAIDRAADQYFDGALINCMGMPSECMFNRSSTVSRCSDDFMPESREWFSKNILQCAYNGLLQGQFYVNDWDMWWTDDAQAVKNSLCRAISGGPIYISDRIGCTNPDILKPLILRDGRILRCDESATPTADCLMQDPTTANRIFKIRNRVGGSGLAAVFNIDAQNRAVSGTLLPEETGLSGGDYAYYEFFTGACGILHRGERLEITLRSNDDFRLYTFVPYCAGEVAVLGRTDLFIGIGAVKETHPHSVTLLEGGRIGFVSEMPIKVTADGRELLTTRRGYLTIAEGDLLDTVLELKKD